MSHAILHMATQAILLNLALNSTPGSSQLPNEKSWTSDEIELAHDELVASGYIEDNPPTLARGLFWDITACGRSAAKELTSRHQRQELYQRTLERINGGVSRLTYQDIQGLAAVPITDEKARATLTWLVDSGLVIGHYVNSGALLRPSLTNRGDDALNSPYGPEDFVTSNITPGVSVNNDYSQYHTGDVNTINGNNSVLNTGSGSATSSGNTIHVTHEALGKLDALMDGLRVKAVEAGSDTTQMEADADKVRDGIKQRSLEVATEGAGALAQSVAKALGPQLAAGVWGLMSWLSGSGLF